MGMRYNFDYGEGDIKLSGMLAQIAVERGYWDTEDCVCVLSWLQVRDLVNDLHERINTAYESAGWMDLYKQGVLTMWLATHDWKDEITFA